MVNGAASAFSRVVHTMSEEALRATIIGTGEELVRGRAADTNGSFLAAELTRYGFEVRRVLVVGDDAECVREEVLQAARDSRLVVVTGGLGPTADDRTRGAVALAAGRALVEDAESRRHVEDRLHAIGRPASERQLSQARFPEGSTVFPNPRGTARGFACRVGQAWVVALPGVPAEMVPMFEESVRPFLLTAFGGLPCHCSGAVHVFPAFESVVDERVADMTAPTRNPSVGITVHEGVVSVSLLAQAATAEEAARLVRDDVAVLDERFGDLVIGHGDATLARALSEELRRCDCTIGVAESVTGGLIGDMLTDVPGISRFLLSDVVAYANEAKVSQLGVSREVIEEHGAVSAEVAEAMAQGICAACGSRLGLSTTGIAGPSGGSPAKPVGLVYVGLALDREAFVVKLNLRGDRWRIKDRAAKHALNAARLALKRGLATLPREYTM